MYVSSGFYGYYIRSVTDRKRDPNVKINPPTPHESRSSSPGIEPSPPNPIGLRLSEAPRHGLARLCSVTLNVFQGPVFVSHPPCPARVIRQVQPERVGRAGADRAIRYGSPCPAPPLPLLSAPRCASGGRGRCRRCLRMWRRIPSPARPGRSSCRPARR